MKHHNKTPTKNILNKAGKTLSNPNTSASKKSAAGKILSQKAAKIRTIQSAPKVGSISRSDAKRAARVVLKKK